MENWKEIIIAYSRFALHYIVVYYKNHLYFLQCKEIIKIDYFKR